MSTKRPIRVVRGVLGLMALVLFVGFACGPSGGSQKALRNNGAECNPYSCECLPSCVCSLVARRPAKDERPATCVGAPLCNTTEDCPESEFDAVCRTGLVVDGPGGLGGICVLPCVETADCPSGMECFDESCVFSVGQ